MSSRTMLFPQIMERATRLRVCRSAWRASGFALRVEEKALEDVRKR